MKKAYVAQAMTKGLFCAVTIGALAGAGIALGQARPPIKVGLVQHLSGPVAPYGVSMKVGAELAIKEINAAGGVAGRQLQVFAADDRSDVTSSVTEATRLVSSEKIDIMLTPSVSQATLAILPILTKANIAGMGLSGSEALTPAVGPYFFSSYVSSDVSVAYMARYVAQTMKAKSVAVIGDGGSNTKYSVQALRKELGAQNISMTGVEEYQYQANDMTPQLLNLRRGNPEVVLLFSSIGTDTGNVLKGLSEIGWNVKVVGSVATGNTSAAAIKIAGPAAFKNAVAVNFRAFSFCPNDSTASRTSDFIKKLNDANPSMAGKLFYPQAASYYDAVYLYKAAIEGTGGKTDGTSIAAWVLDKGKSLSGILLANPTPTKTDHFLVSLDALTMTRMEQERADDRMQMRADCK